MKSLTRQIFHSYRWQFGFWIISIPSYVFLFFDTAPVALPLDTLARVVFFKSAVALLATAYLLCLLTALHICPMMPFGVPHAMLQLFGKDDLLQLGTMLFCPPELLKPAATDSPTLLQLISGLLAIDPFIKRDLFSLSSIPYRFYPLSCILLE